jgi:predicted transcriptional regulator of viral defense system
MMMARLSGIGIKGRAKLSRVLQKNPDILTAPIVSACLKISPIQANLLLARWNQSGWAKRVKRGTYIPVPVEASSPDVTLAEPFMIAHSLYKDGYVGGFSAVKHWDLSEQIIETTYYFTTKKIRDHDPKHGAFKFKIKTIKPDKMFGLKSIWYGSQKISISDPSKTIVDILNDPKLVGGMTIVYDIFKEYLESKYCDLPLLLDYAKKMKNKTILKRLGFMLETKFETIPEIFKNLDNEISTGHSKYDPLLKCDFIVEKWMLKVPESWKREYDRKK